MTTYRSLRVVTEDNCWVKPTEAGYAEYTDCLDRLGSHSVPA
jgi:hypothetical protein